MMADYLIQHFQSCFGVMLLDFCGLGAVAGTGKEPLLCAREPYATAWLFCSCSVQEQATQRTLQRGAAGCCTVFLLYSYFFKQLMQSSLWERRKEAFCSHPDAARLTHL
jgi:hypothetical protein